MTAEEFNEKYRKYAETGFEDRLLEFDIPEVTKHLDILFESTLIHVPDFNFAQIKLKFGYARFYTSLPYETERFIEAGINKLVKDSGTF